jgi:hypothetical protein
MQNIIQKISSSLSLFLVCMLITIPTLAQKKEGKENKQEQKLLPDGTIHLRIEKYENGQKQVYEHTIKKEIYPGVRFQTALCLIQLTLWLHLDSSKTKGMIP